MTPSELEAIRARDAEMTGPPDYPAAYRAAMDRQDLLAYVDELRSRLAETESRLNLADAEVTMLRHFNAEAEALLREARYGYRTPELLDRIDAALSSTLGQGESGAYPAAEGMARAEAVVTPGTPGGGASVEPSAATENPEAMYNPVARKSHAGASARQIDVAAGDPSALLYCEHPAALLVRSAETGEPLYCELCDDKSGRRDAEQCEVDIQARLAEAEERHSRHVKGVGELADRAARVSEIIAYCAQEGHDGEPYDTINAIATGEYSTRGGGNP